MKTYQVKMPDGKTYPVTGPEGATEQELRAAVAEEHRTAMIPRNSAAMSSAPSAAEGMNAYERWGAGMRAGVEEKKLGYQQAADALTGKKSEDELKQEVADLNKTHKDLLDTGFIAQAGNVVGQGLFDLPAMAAGGWALKGLGALARSGVVKDIPFLPGAVKAATNAPRAVKASANMLKNFGAGGFAGVTSPSENYDFVKQALQGGASAIPGTIGGWAASRVANPFGMQPPDINSPNTSTADLAKRLLAMEDMPGVLAENRVNRDTSRIPATTNALAQVPIGGGGVRENRAKLGAARTRDVSRTAGVESESLGPTHGAAVNQRVTEQWDRLRTFPDIPLHDMPPHLQDALEAVRRNPDLLGTKDPIVSALERLIEETSAKGAGKINPNRPGIFGTLDDLAKQQPGGPTLAQIVEQESSNLPGGPGRVAPPPMTPIDLWGISDPTTLAGNRYKVPFRSGSSTVQGAQPGFTEPGHPTGGPFTGSTRFEIPEEPPPPKLPTMTAEEALRQHSEISRRLRDASVTAPDADKRLLYRSLLKSLDEQMEKAWGKDKWNEYQKVRLEEGAQRDQEVLKHRGGDVPSAKVVLDRMEENTPGVSLNPQTPLEQRIEAQAKQAPEPSLTENRSGNISMVTGNPMRTFGTSMVGGGILGNMLTGAGMNGTLAGMAAGVGVPAAALTLSHILLGMEGPGRYLVGQNKSRIGRIAQSPEFSDFLERAGLSTANTMGQQYFDDTREDNWPYHFKD